MLRTGAAVLLIILLVGASMLFVPKSQQAAAALDTEPTRKAEIVIQASKVDENLADFPVLLTKDSVPTEACDADGTSPAQDGGGDIRFTSDENGNTQLPLDVVRFHTDNDPANCVVEMYVKVPSISATTDTSIWMWYNTAASDTQPSASSTYGSQNVWNSAFKGVWHLAESSGNRYDVTANANTLTDNNTVASATGKWNTAADFEEGNSEYLSIADGSQTNLDVSGDLTVSTWVKIEDAPTTNEVDMIASKMDTGPDDLAYSFAYKDVSGTKKLALEITSNSTSGGVDVAADLGTGAWHQVAVSYNSAAGSAAFYVDGAQVGSTQTGLPTSIRNSAAPFQLGASENPAVNHFDGLMQTTELSTAARSTGWLNAEYNNQSDPATFAVDQAPQLGATAPESATVIKPSDESVTSSTTLQDDDAFTFALKANTKYVISGGLFATSTVAQPDIKIAFTVPSGATMDIGYLAQGGSSRTAELLETSGTASAQIDIPANTNTLIQQFGSVVTSSTSGNLQLKWAQFSSNATATKIKQGSFITVTEVTE